MTRQSAVLIKHLHDITLYEIFHISEDGLGIAAQIFSYIA